MSPTPSVVTAFTLSTVAPSPSPAPDPGSGGQSPMTSIHLLGTGGLLFAVVAIVSVAGYLYHGRGATNDARTSNPWASFNSFLSAIRHRGLASSTAVATASDWPRDLEVGPQQHVNMVYAKFFHPTFWNVVEYHSGTSSRPEIYVEDEAKEAPASGPTPPGMNSFLDMNEDHEEGNGPKRADGKPDRGGSWRVEAIPPFDLRAATNVGFDSKVIGSTVRQEAFLCIPGEQEPEDDASFEDSLAESELDISCLAYDGIVTSTEPPSSCGVRRYGMADMTNLAESLKDAIPEEGYDMGRAISRETGVVNVAQNSEDATLESHGLVRMVSCRTCLKSVIPEEARDLASEVSRRIGLVNIVDLEQTDEDMLCGLVEHLERVNDGLAIPECDIGPRDVQAQSAQIDTTRSCRPLAFFESLQDDLASADCSFGVHDSCDSLRTSASATDTHVTVHEDTSLTTVDRNSSDLGVHDSRDGLRTSAIATDTDDDFHEGMELMRQILVELRDLKEGCDPRALSEDSESEYDDDDCDFGKGMKRGSLESTPSTRTSDELWEGLIYPPTRPLNIFRAPGVHKGHKRCPALPWTNEGAATMSLGLPQSPLSFQTKGYVHTHRYGHSLHHGSRIAE